MSTIMAPDSPSRRTFCRQACRAASAWAAALPIVLGGAAASGLVVSGAPPATVWRVSTALVALDCRLTVGGSFEARSRSLAGTLRVDTERPAALAGELSVDLTTFDTGISLRNTHLKDVYFETERGDGFANALLSDIVLTDVDVATFRGRTTFAGQLTLHGVTRPIAGDVRLESVPGGVRVSAGFLVMISEFEIPPPRYLGVGVRDLVHVRVEFIAGES